MNAICASVLEEIRPKRTSAVTLFTSKFSKYISGKLILGGSYAKNTHIGASFDCDIFVQFNSEKEMIGLKKAVVSFTKSEKISYQLVHGSRDYFRVEFKGVIFELIPVLKLKQIEDAKNIMDHSPYHVQWFLENGKKYADDIRLLKQFLKSARVYGAESYIRGFSGHIVDILVIHYKGFENTIKAIASWKKTSSKQFKKIIVDINKSYKGKDVLFYMNESKTYAPLIVVDPILSDRNAAAALSTEKFDKAIESAKNFLKKPSKSYFQVKKITADSFKKYKKPVIVCEVIPLDGEKDIVGTKLLKALEHIVKKLSDNGFSVITYDWEWNGVSGKEGFTEFFIVLDSLVIPSTYVHLGPPSSLPEAVKAFRSKYSSAKLKDGKYSVVLKRKFVDASKLVASLSEDKYLQEKLFSLTTKR